MVSCGILSLSSCSNDEDIIESSTNKTELDNQPDVVVSSTKYWMASENSSKRGVMPIDEPILQFKDEAAYNRITDELKRKTAEERVAYFEKLGFNGAYRQLIQADDELDYIFDNIDDSIQFINKIAEFKRKYRSKFYFNENDTLDATPYLNYNDDKLFYVGNILGMAVVGNKLIRPINSSPAKSMYGHRFIDSKGRSGRFTNIYKMKKGKKRYSSIIFGFIDTYGTVAVRFESEWKRCFITRRVYKDVSYSGYIKIGDDNFRQFTWSEKDGPFINLGLPIKYYLPSFKAEIKDFKSSYCPYPKSTILNNIILKAAY